MDIKTVKDLYNIRNNLSATYVLANDIDLSSIDNWTPIGNSWDNSFTGTLYGCGHKITGLNINSISNNTGLFGYTKGATIRDLQIDDANVTSTSGYTGTLAGYACSTTIDNVVVTNTTINGRYYTGGLVGNGYNITISNSYSTGDVTGRDSTGGLAGCCYGTISNSYTTGTVTGTSEVGGLAGSLSSGTISNSYSTGNVTGTSQTGGLAGYLYNCTISNSYSIGNVTGVRKNNLIGLFRNKNVVAIINNLPTILYPIH